jgi:hypothetical protein
MLSGGSCFSERSKALSFVPHSAAERCVSRYDERVSRVDPEVELCIARPSSVTLGLRHVEIPFSPSLYSCL